MINPTVNHAMSDNEYAEAREAGLYVCPLCRSLNINELDALTWDDPACDEEYALVRLSCFNCSARWTEILRPVGYEMG